MKGHKTHTWLIWELTECSPYLTEGEDVGSVLSTIERVQLKYILIRFSLALVPCQPDAEAKFLTPGSSTVTISGLKMLTFFFSFNCLASSWTTGASTQLLHSPSLRDLLLTELSLRSFVCIAEHCSPWHDEGHRSAPASLFLIHFSLNRGIIKSQQQTAALWHRSDVRVAKWPCCQRGKANWIHSKTAFFPVFWQIVHFPVCFFTKSTIFPDRNTWQGKAQLLVLPVGILNNSSGLISCLIYVQCSHLASSSLSSKWLFNLYPMEKEKVRTCSSPEKGFLIALAWHSNLVSSWPLIDFN